MSCFPSILLTVFLTSWNFSNFKGAFLQGRNKQTNFCLIAVAKTSNTMFKKNKTLLNKKPFFNSPLHNECSFNTAYFYLCRWSLWPGPHTQKGPVLGFQHLEILTVRSLNLCFIMEVLWDSRACMWAKEICTIEMSAIACHRIRIPYLWRPMGTKFW